ncbi:hypothetical protein BC777_1770 [Yoonia maricola]|uniref:2OG-Fe dioxygenase family protein n=1 Tax=Yoonia maricola TaxID=420999 RepID=A0A2M8WPP5_9RHOB|nr:2OG-Fe dioxygenase family protein [Yoonia maricola]PJI92905.1 hypothetical protein BC777_1770 [Yoonia maricola]
MTSAQAIAQKHFVHIPALADTLAVTTDELRGFSAFWNDLVRDEKYREFTNRRRRLLRYSRSCDGVLTPRKDMTILPKVKRPIAGSHKPNHVSAAPASFAGHPLTKRLLAFDLQMIPQSAQPAEIDIHLFRVIADHQQCSPTTSGIHKDGADWVFMHFIKSDGCEPVPSRLFADAAGKEKVFEAVLSQFCETLVVDDMHLYHEAGPVQAKQTCHAAYRDMLVVTVHTQRHRPKENLT